MRRGMKRVKRMIIALVLGALAVAALCPPGWAEQEMTKAQQRLLFRQGAKLWPVYCAQCHNARPGSEFAPHQWDAIMMHMRTQANLPAQDARAVLEYLKGSH
jgi:mono/diheme cytochrome c family protein